MDNLKLTEQMLSSINTGKMASVVYSHIAPTIGKLREGIVANLMTDFRSGAFSGGKAEAAVAQLVVLQDLENSLRVQITKGESVATKAIKGD